MPRSRPFAEFDRAADQVRLRVRRHGDVEDLDLRVGEQCVDGVVNGRDRVLRGDFARGGGVPRRDGDGVEAGVAVRDEVAVAHDEPGPDAADPPVLALRESRAVVEVEGERVGDIALSLAGSGGAHHCAARAAAGS